MATKVDNPTSTNGLGLPMSKEPFRPLACCRVGRGMGSPIPSPEEGAWTREGPKVVE